MSQLRPIERILVSHKPETGMQLEIIPQDLAAAQQIGFLLGTEPVMTARSDHAIVLCERDAHGSLDVFMEENGLQALLDTPYHDRDGTQIPFLTARDAHAVNVALIRKGIASGSDKPAFTINADVSEQEASKPDDIDAVDDIVPNQKHIVRKDQHVSIDISSKGGVPTLHVKVHQTRNATMHSLVVSEVHKALGQDPEDTTPTMNITGKTEVKKALRALHGADFISEDRLTWGTRRVEYLTTVHRDKSHPRRSLRTTPFIGDEGEEPGFRAHIAGGREFDYPGEEEGEEINRRVDKLNTPFEGGVVAVAPRAKGGMVQE